MKNELQGLWEATLHHPDTKDIKFQLLVAEKQAFLLNGHGDERMALLPGIWQGDSLTLHHPVFDSYLVIKQQKKGFGGYWKDNSRKGDYRMTLALTRSVPVTTQPTFTDTTRWQCVFDTAWDAYPAIAVISRAGKKLKGTFLTETGDYRYLAGEIEEDNQFYLSCFDGAHAFAFYGNMDKEKMRGTFYSGYHWQAPFVGVLNDSAKLTDGFFLTKSTSDQPISFTWEDEQMVSHTLQDSAYRNRPLLIQVMGTWCPNCLDETNYLVALQQNPKHKINILALCFERGVDKEAQWRQINKVKNNLKVPYPMVLVDKADKKTAAEWLQFVDGIQSFPTTIFLNSRHEIVGVHTGFNGPATSELFTKQSEAFEALIEKLNAQQRQ